MRAVEGYMRHGVILFALLVGSVALAKPWHGIDPGVTHLDEVLLKFGKPSRRMPAGAKEIVGYFEKEAIKGTTQAQFRVDSVTKIVERIDVFPAVTVDRAAVEGAYGPECPAGPPPPTPCYKKKKADDGKVYFQYVSLGLAVFFTEDEKTVFSLIFQPGKK